MLKPVKSLVVGGAVALTGLLLATSVQAATTHNQVVTDYYITVVPAQWSAFETGTKSWEKCLGQHGDKQAMHAYDSASGDLSVYQFVSDPQPWADLDARDPAGKACDATFKSDVLPHVAKAGMDFLVTMPGYSHLPKNEPFGLHHVRAVLFTLKSGEASNKAFKEAVKEIYAAANKTHDSPHPHYSVTYAIEGGGNHNKADYLLVGEFKSWAEFGAGPNPTLMKMLGNAYGKAKAHDIMHALRGSVKTATAKFYRYDASLSYTPQSR